MRTRDKERAETVTSAPNARLSRALGALTRMNDYLSSIQIVLAVLLLLVFVGLTATEVFQRYVLSASMIWSPEIATMALIWSVFLASAVCFRRGEHLIVNVYSPRGARSKRVNTWTVGLFNLCYLVAILYYGFMSLPVGMNVGTPILSVPLTIGYTALIVMGITGIMYIMEIMIRSMVVKELSNNSPVDVQ